jgi:hypothetical protein
MNKAETRAEHIDPALPAAGWGVVEGSRIRREHPITLGRIEGQGRRGKALTADYVLVYRNTLPVIEAKAWDERPQSVPVPCRLTDRRRLRIQGGQARFGVLGKTAIGYLGRTAIVRPCGRGTHGVVSSAPYTVAIRGCACVQCTPTLRWSCFRKL